MHSTVACSNMLRYSFLTSGSKKIYIHPYFFKRILTALSQCTVPRILFFFFISFFFPQKTKKKKRNVKHACYHKCFSILLSKNFFFALIMLREREKAALKSLVKQVYPTASIAFCSPFTSRIQISPSSPTTSESLWIPPTGSRWSFLAQKYVPMVFALGEDRASSSGSNHSVSSVSSALKCPLLRWDFVPHSAAPCRRYWPVGLSHAVVKLGGYERVDLVSIVAPLLLSALPTTIRSAYPIALGEQKEYDGSDYLPLNEKSVQGCRKPPAWWVRHQTKGLVTTSIAKNTSGCMYLGGDALSIHVPIPSIAQPCSSSMVPYKAMYLAFSSTDLSLSALLHETQPARRAVMRSGFGYCAALLREALPYPCVEAVRRVRKWEAFISASLPTSSPQQQQSSSAFLVSALFHVLQNTPEDYIKIIVEAILRTLCTFHEDDHLLLADCAVESSDKIKTFKSNLLEAFKEMQNATFCQSHQNEIKAASDSNGTLSNTLLSQSAIEESYIALLGLATVFFLLHSDYHVTPVGRENRKREPGSYAHLWETNFFLPEEHFLHLQDTAVWKTRGESMKVVWSSCVQFFLRG